jgi:replication-associated recombination protein RarA
MKRSGSLGGRAFLLSGRSGIGKSTAAYLIAQDVCDHDNIVEINATIVTPKMIQDWWRSAGQLLIGEKSGKAIVVNEVHKLRTDVVTLLLEVLEDVRSHTVWVFTTQGKTQAGLFDDDDSGALESRCVKFSLESRPYRIHFSKFAKAVAEREGLGGAGFEAYLAKFDDCDGNLREMLSAIEAGEFLVEDDDSDAMLGELMATV